MPNTFVIESTTEGVIDDTNHGSRAGGTLHADATTSVAGFMSAADKTKLNLVPSGGGFLQSAVAAQPVVDISTSSAAFVDMPGITVSITTGANKVIIWFTSLFETTSAGAVTGYRLLIDGVNQGGGNLKPGGSSGLVASINKLAPVTAGLHVVKVQWRVSAGTLSCKPTTNPDTAHVSLIVAEVSA